MEPLTHLLHDLTRDDPPDRLDRALERGIITRAQYDAILALDEPAGAARGAEGPRGLNWISVAYSIGALIVLFALGWFLAERWRDLGAGGVLATTGVYAALFGTASWWLRRTGFPTAGGIAAVLAVSMTPLIAWSVMELAGLWPDRPPSPLPYFDAPARVPVRWLVMEVATIAVALLTLRHVRYAGLMAPIAGALWFLSAHLAQGFLDPAMVRAIGPYVSVVFATGMLAAAYVVDRHGDGREDYAAWLYLAGMLALTIAYVEVWRTLGPGRHLLPAVALALIAASLYLRRRIFVVAGSAYLLFYLGYLAFELFRRSVAFPALLAALGTAVILGAVWLQRRYPRLVERVRSKRAGRVSLPGGYVTALAPAAVAAILLVLAIPAARRRADTIRAENREAARRAEQARPAPTRPRGP